jgi:hypothetical protein
MPTLKKTLARKTEDAVIAWLKGNATLAALETAQHKFFHNSVSVALASHPICVVDCEVGTEEPRGSGVYPMNVEITVRSQANDSTTAAFDDLVENLIDRLARDNLADELSALQSDFKIHGVLGRAEMPLSVVDHSWVRGVSLELTGMAMSA